MGSGAGVDVDFGESHKGMGSDNGVDMPLEGGERGVLDRDEGLERMEEQKCIRPREICALGVTESISEPRVLAHPPTPSRVPRPTRLHVRITRNPANYVALTGTNREWWSWGHILLW